MPMGQFVACNAAIWADVNWQQISIIQTLASPIIQILPRWHGQLVLKVSVLTGLVILAMPYKLELPAAGLILLMPISVVI